jgi:hypothetical protein
MPTNFSGGGVVERSCRFHAASSASKSPAESPTRGSVLEAAVPLEAVDTSPAGGAVPEPARAEAQAIAPSGSAAASRNEQRRRAGDRRAPGRPSVERATGRATGVMTSSFVGMALDW